VQKDIAPKEFKAPPELVPTSETSTGHRRPSDASLLSTGSPKQDGLLSSTPNSFVDRLRRGSTLLSDTFPTNPTTEDLVYTTLRHPCISPHHSNFTSYPPALFQAGECELLVDEIVATAHKYALHNPGQSKVRCEVFHNLTHVPQAYPGSAGGAVALRNIGRFVRNLFNEEDGSKHVHEADPHILRSLALGKDAGDVEVFYGGFGEVDEVEDEVQRTEAELEMLKERVEEEIPSAMDEDEEDHWIPGAI